MSNTTDVAGTIPNDTRFADLMKKARTYGGVSVKGENALLDMAKQAINAAADGVIDTDTVDANGADHAALIYGEYVAGRNKVGGVADNTTKRTTSELRQMITMGCMSSIGHPMETVDEALRVRKELVGNKVKVVNTWSAMIAVSRATIAAGRKLDVTELEALVTKTVRDKDALEKLGDIYSKAHKVHEDFAVNDAETADLIEQAIEALKAAIGSAGGDAGEFDGTNKKKATAAKKVAKFGLTGAQLREMLEAMGA